MKSIRGAAIAALLVALIGTWPAARPLFAQQSTAGQQQAPVSSPGVATTSAPARRPVHPQRPARVNPLEQRVQLLTRELALNPEQQQAVREILLQQRNAVSRIWQDPAITPAERAPAVRSVGDQTADRIRSVLSEEQKRKYNRPLPSGALPAQSNTDVEGWLRAARGQTQQTPLGVPLPSSTPRSPEAP